MHDLTIRFAVNDLRPREYWIRDSYCSPVLGYVAGQDNVRGYVYCVNVIKNCGLCPVCSL